ncbi:hypothetical protein M3Y96_00134700 [Aphelenchoides besseyi]|nr:hypothetical protein M3Y96_00134700 [Aphelenchoides besseyi]
MGALRHRFHSMVFEAAVITQIVSFTLLMLYSKKTDQRPKIMWILSAVFSAVGSVLLIVGWIMHAVKKFRRNIPPLTYVLTAGIGAVLGIITAVLSGIIGFGKETKSDVMVAAMAYAIASIALVITLIVLLLVFPPLLDSDYQRIRSEK